jgi:hypothetical protein
LFTCNSATLCHSSWTAAVLPPGASPAECEALVEQAVAKALAKMPVLKLGEGHVADTFPRCMPTLSCGEERAALNHWFRVLLTATRTAFTTLWWDSYPKESLYYGCVVEPNTLGPNANFIAFAEVSLRKSLHPGACK